MVALRPPLHPHSPSSSPAPKTPVKPEHRVNRVLPTSPDSVEDFWVKPSMVQSSCSLVSQSACGHSVSDSQGNDIDRLSAVRIAVLDKLFEFPAALDDGADMTLIGSNVWEVLQNTGIYFSPESIELKLADGSISSVRKSFVSICTFRHRQVRLSLVIRKFLSPMCFFLTFYWADLYCFHWVSTSNVSFAALPAAVFLSTVPILPALAAKISMTVTLNISELDL